MEKNIAKCMQTPIYGNKIVSSNGVHIEDEFGNKFIDMLSGASVTILGYSNNDIIRTFMSAASKVQHTCFPYSPNYEAVELAEKLVSLFPCKSKKSVCFGLSGSDSVDGAIKMARTFTKKKKIISFVNAYHGSTGFSVKATVWKGVTSNSKKHIHIDFPKNSFEERRVLAELKNIISKGGVAALIFEPIQGDGGVIVPSNSFLQDVCKICAENGVITIADEVQSGMGRTGKFFAFENFGVVPDIVVMAKSLGAGYVPISAIVGRDDVVNSLSEVQHLFTFSAHPPSCAVANKVIDKLHENEVVTNAKEVGDYFIDELNNIDSDLIKEVRGMGLMIGVEVPKENSKIIIRRCFEKGVYFGVFGTKNEVIRIEPPLIITKKDVDFTVNVLKEVLSELQAGLIPRQTIEKAMQCVSLGN